MTSPHVAVGTDWRNEWPKGGTHMICVKQSSKPHGLKYVTVTTARAHSCALCGFAPNPLYYRPTATQFTIVLVVLAALYGPRAAPVYPARVFCASDAYTLHRTECNLFIVPCHVKHRNTHTRTQTRGQIHTITRACAHTHTHTHTNTHTNTLTHARTRTLSHTQIAPFKSSFDDE